MELSKPFGIYVEIARGSFEQKAKPNKKKAKPTPGLSLYEDWSYQQLIKRASVVGIKEWASLNRKELIEALKRA